MDYLDLTLALAGLPVLAAGLYLLGLTVLSLWPRRPSRLDDTVRFRIVVPAHNEEQGIARTLWSLRRIDYPQSRHQVVVVADNCTDDTARIARECGARVLERRDSERRGKGYALQFAFEELAKEPLAAWEAAVVVDADSTVTPNLLQVLAGRITSDAQAVQALYLPAPAQGATLSLITEVAFTAFHLVRSVGRERLGLSTGLRGNGMAFRRALLHAVPHDAFSRTEDLEFGVRLGLRGVRVAFAADATVFGEMPAGAEVASVQRSRWIGGRMEMARNLVPTLLRESIRRRSAMLADLALDLLVPPVSALVLALAVGTLASTATALLTGQVGPAILVWLAADAAVGLHVLDAARRAGRVGGLLRAPLALALYAGDKLLITLRSLQTTDTTWVRTARAGESR